MARLLVNYVLQSLVGYAVRMTPPNLSRLEYLQAVIKSQRVDAFPYDLAAMIIEGFWFTLKDAACLRTSSLEPSSRGEMFIVKGGIINRDRYDILDLDDVSED